MAEPSAVPATRRLFFALWPAADAQNALDAAARSAHVACGGRRMPGDSLHLTLAFLGDVPVDRIDAAEAAADDLGGAAFLLSLDRLGYWRHNRIFWAGCDEVPASMLELVGTLSMRLRAAGFAIESRPFAAHVTLLRAARCQTLPSLTAPIDWPVTDLVLAESHLSIHGARYRVRRGWSLRAP